jgi:hypothetical protein
MGRGFGVVAVGTSALCAAGLLGAPATLAASDVSYVGGHGPSVYASFVVNSGKVVGLFVGGPCLPNISLIEEGTNKPVPIRSGAFKYRAIKQRYHVSLTATALSKTSYRVRFVLVNRDAKSTCSASVVARRTKD